MLLVTCACIYLVKYPAVFTGNGTWEHFVRHLEKRLAVDVELVSRDRLSSTEVSEGKKVELVVREWSTREDVTVGLFDQVSRELGHGRSVHRILMQIQQAERDSIVLPSDRRNSSVEVV